MGAAGAVKANAERQLELLKCAAGLVRPGGVILYVTCALSEQENDGVVSKFLKREGQEFRVEPVPDMLPINGREIPLLPGAERTGFGVMIMPDRTPYGPI